MCSTSYNGHPLDKPTDRQPSSPNMLLLNQRTKRNILLDGLKLTINCYHQNFPAKISILCIEMCKLFTERVTLI